MIPMIFLPNFPTPCDFYYLKITPTILRLLLWLWMHVVIMISMDVPWLMVRLKEEML